MPPTTPPQSSSERPALRRCPFCASEALSGNGFSPYESITYAWCSNHDCSLNHETLFTPEEWNTRAPQPVDAAEDDIKLAYVKRWRTIVKLPAKYADEIVEALRGVAQTAKEPFPAMAALLTTLNVMKSAHGRGSDRLMCIWESDVKAVEAAVEALSIPSTPSKTPIIEPINSVGMRGANKQAHADHASMLTSTHRETPK